MIVQWKMVNYYCDYNLAKDYENDLVCLGEEDFCGNSYIKNNKQARINGWRKRKGKDICPNCQDFLRNK